MSTSLMPIAILFRQMTDRISFTANRSKAIKELVFILLFALTMAYLLSTLHKWPYSIFTVKCLLGGLVYLLCFLTPFSFLLCLFF